MNNRIKILIIDDNQADADTLARVLMDTSLRPEVVVAKMPPASPTEKNDIFRIALAKTSGRHLELSDAITFGAWDYIFCDFTLSPWPIGEVLDALSTKITNRPKVCFVSQGLLRISSIMAFIDAYKQFDIQKIWLGKPITKEDIESFFESFGDAEQTKNNSHEKATIRKFKDGTPFPVRVYDKRRKTSTVNPHWPFAQNRPEIDETDVNISVDAYKEKLFWNRGAQQNDSTTGIYQIIGFHSPIDDNKYIEMAFPKKTETIRRGDIQTYFNAMEEVGLHRGRFYRLIEIPHLSGETNTVELHKELIHYYGSHYRDPPATISPCSDFTATAINDLNKNTTKSTPGGIIQDPKGSNKSIFHLIGRYPVLTETDIITQPKTELTRLFIPIIQENRGMNHVSATQEEFLTYSKVIGYFIFDRWNGKTEDVLDESFLIPLFDVFDELISDVRKNISQDDERVINKSLATIKKREQEIKTTDFTKTIPSGETDLNKQIMDSALSLSKAKQGIFVRRRKQSYLSVMECGENSFFVKANLPIDADVLPIVACWKTKKPVFIPDFQAWLKVHPGLTERELVRKFLTEEKQQNDYKKWIKSIGSYVAIPVTFGDETVGALNLTHVKKHWFTKNKLNRVCIFLDSCAWYLRQVRAVNDLREHWEQLMMHEIKSYTSMMLRNCTSFNDDVSSSSEYRLGLALLADLSTIYDYYGKINPLKQSEYGETVRGNDQFDCKEIIKKTFSLFEPMTGIKNQTVGLNSVEARYRIVQGNEKIIGLIIRVLMDNASKFGARDSDIGWKICDAGTCKSTRRNTNFVCVTVTNTVKTYNDKALKHAFEGKYFIPDANKSKDGSHIALYTSKKLIEEIGGTLNLWGDETGKTVTATLQLPKSSHVKKNA